ncbi:MAG: MerR family transcriptional regulator [Deltaproteobacteria bacterium]|nr:MerR family transcriptional regulator [Deltaproteobacteria bacterium]
MKETTIPNKLYFRIGEVADLLAIKPYVLRYWETEFPDIKPAKSKSGQRLYKRRDVEMLIRIKELLYHERFTINGARKRLKELIREQRGNETATVTQIPLVLNGDSPSSKGVSSGLADQNSPQVSIVKKSSSSSQVPSLDSRKILTKLKRDLQSMLDDLK